VDVQSFLDIRNKWYPLLERSSLCRLPIVLVGLKQDLRNQCISQRVKSDENNLISISTSTPKNIYWNEDIVYYIIRYLDTRSVCRLYSVSKTINKHLGSISKRDILMRYKLYDNFIYSHQAELLCKDIRGRKYIELSSLHFPSQDWEKTIRAEMSKLLTSFISLVTSYPIKRVFYQD